MATASTERKTAQAPPLLKQVQLHNLLSFGPKSEPVILEPLNVIIGPNGSGKSNFVAALNVLRAAPKDITVPIRQGGGILEWLWKGALAEPLMRISVVVPFPGRKSDLHYQIGMGASGVKTAVYDEAVEDFPLYQRDKHRAYFYYRYMGTQSLLWESGGHDRTKEYKHWPRHEERTVLAGLRDPARYTEITYLAEHLARIAIYREWDTGPDGVLRRPQRADLPEDFLLEDASNLAMVLSDLQQDRERWSRLMMYFRRFYPAADTISIKPSGGTVQVFLFEKDITNPISAYRLSDGTLRFLCLLAVLFQRGSPPLICLEEPENYLHRDALSILGELFVEASSRTQLIVTTHATALVSAMTLRPHSVLVCERFEDGTRLRRLEPAKLEHWLDKYDLGEIWRMGEIGGNLA